MKEDPLTPGEVPCFSVHPQARRCSTPVLGQPVPETKTLVGPTQAGTGRGRRRSHSGPVSLGGVFLYKHGAPDPSPSVCRREGERGGSDGGSTGPDPVNLGPPWRDSGPHPLAGSDVKWSPESTPVPSLSRPTARIPGVNHQEDDAAESPEGRTETDTTGL